MRTFVSHFLFTYLFLLLSHSVSLLFSAYICFTLSFSLPIFFLPLFPFKRRQFSVFLVCYWLCATIFIFNLVDFSPTSYLTWTLPLCLFHFCKFVSIVYANFPWHQNTKENKKCFIPITK